MQKEETKSKEEYVEEEERRKREKAEEKKKEELKAITLEKEKERIDTIPPKKEEEPTEIPFIKLEKISEFEPKRLELSKEIHKIEKVRRMVSVPIIELQKPSFTLREYELDYKMLRIEKTRKLLTVPIIRVKSSPRLSLLLTELDAEIRKPSEIKLPKIRVPVYRKAISISPKFLLESFDSAISEQLTERLERKEEIREELPVERVRMEKVGAGVPSTGGEEEEIPEFLEIAFGSEGGKIRAKGPKIILFKDLEGDSYVDFLKNVCLRIYREREGGEPKSVEIRKIDDMNKREIEKWLEAGGKIFTIDLDHIREGEKLDETHLWEKLEETYTERLGFIIFTTKKKEIFEHFETLLQRINNKAQGKLNIVELESKKLPIGLASLCSGMINLDIPPIKMEVEKIPTLTTFDFIVNGALFNEESLFNKILESIKSQEKAIFKESTNPAKEVESALHFNIKVFLVRFLTHKLRKEGKKLFTREEIMKEIETEKELTPQAIPDVKAGNKVYEVETLFGPHAGEEPDLKINKTIDKYDEVGGINEVNMIMDNFGSLIHLKDLLRKKEHFSRKKFNVEFYTLNLRNKQLISLSDFAKELKQYLKQQ